MPRLTKNQNYAVDSAPQTDLKDEPIIWVKLTDVFGDTPIIKVSDLICRNNPTEYGAVTAVPFTYFARFGSHQAAEAVIKSNVKLQKEYIHIDPVALFPDWKNAQLMFPEHFVEPTIKITCSIIKDNSTLKETESQMLDVLCNRLQREWRFSRLDSQITVYLTSENGVEEAPKLVSLVPPGFRLVTHVEPLRRNLSPNLSRAEGRTAGCIRTPDSGAKTQMRLSGHPYASKGARPPSSNHTETGGKGKGKKAVKRIREGDHAGEAEEVVFISTRSRWRLGQQVKSPGKPWIKTPWRPQDEPPSPTPLPIYDVSMPTNIDTLKRKIEIWNGLNEIPQPTEETLAATLGELPIEGEGLAVMAQMRAGTANPYQLVKELEKMGKRIGPHDAAVYYLMLRVKVGRIMLAARRIKGISTTRRTRICEDLSNLVKKLMSQGYTPDHEIHLLYTGDTMCIKDRSGFDTIDIIHLGPNEEDNRRPVTVLMDHAADVYSLSEVGFVSFEEDGTWLWGDPGVVTSRLPKVLRIPVIATNEVSEDVKKVAEQTAMGAMHPPHFNVRPGGSVDYVVSETLVQAVVDEIADVVDPMEDVLWLSDAPGSKGRKLDKTHTGPLVINLMKRFLSGDEASTVVPLDFHGLDPFHPSNIIICTTPEIIFVIDGIKPNHYFIIIMGAQVALRNAIEHLFGGSMKAEDVRFFEPYQIEYKQVQRIFLVIPHPGVHNYVPFAKWTKEAFAHGLARICLIAATLNRLKPSTPDSHTLVTQTLPSVKSSAVDAFLSPSLSLYGIRAPWNGATASNIGKMMDREKITFEQALSVTSPKKNRGIITSLTPPDPDHPRNDAPIIFPHINPNLAYVGQMSFSVFCPASPTDGVPNSTVTSILIDARWRSKVEDVEGYLMVDPSTMELKFEIVGGGILVNDEGDPFIMKRACWMVSTSLGSTQKILENLLRVHGSWKPLTEFEQREIHARNEKEQYRIVSRSNLVHTFLAEEVEEGVNRGDLSLIKLRATHIDIRAWSQSLHAFFLLHQREWQVPKAFFEHRTGATHFALTYDFGKKRWEFPLYHISERTHWKAKYIGVLDYTISSSSMPGSYLVKNGETSELFKMQRLEYENQRSGGRAGSSTT